MENDAFQLFAEIIELTEKPVVPSGEMGQNVSGESLEFDEKSQQETSYRAIIDMGLLDIEENHIRLKNKNYSIVGASSDMLVVDIGRNKKDLKVGDLLEFEMDYMGTLRIMNSKYVDKRIKQASSREKNPAIN
jgi:predicted amino acid racemase